MELSLVEAAAQAEAAQTMEAAVQEQQIKAVTAAPPVEIVVAEVAAQAL